MTDISRILVATDLSSGSARAVARAVLMAVQHRAHLTVVHVIDPALPTEVRLDAAGAFRSIEERLRWQVESLLEQQRSEQPVGVEVRVVEGRDFVRIIAESRTAAADLVVLGAHGEHTVRDLFLGTTAEKVLRLGDRPVLVVKRVPRAPYRNLLVPVDFSEASGLALELAVRLAPGQALRVLHVPDVAFERTLRLAGATAEELARYRAERVGAGTEELERFLDEAAGAVASGTGRSRFEPLVEPGRPAEVIPAVARRRRADLVVMGTRGRAASPDLPLGSVAEHVVRDVRCDVLLVRPPGIRSEMVRAGLL